MRHCRGHRSTLHRRRSQGRIRCRCYIPGQCLFCTLPRRRRLESRLNTQVCCLNRQFPWPCCCMYRRFLRHCKLCTCQCMHCCNKPRLRNSRSRIRTPSRTFSHWPTSTVAVYSASRCTRYHLCMQSSPMGPADPEELQHIRPIVPQHYMRGRFVGTLIRNKPHLHNRYSDKPYPPCMSCHPLVWQRKFPSCPSLHCNRRWRRNPYPSRSRSCIVPTPHCKGTERIES